MDPTDQIIAAESGGDPNALNLSSSAAGLGQFIDSTWIETLSKHKPEIAAGKSRDELLALKTDPTLSREMTAAYGSDNAKVLAAAGLPVTPATTYLAHFAGPTGATKLLTADPAQPVSAVLDASAIKANPFLRNMTVAGLQSWASGKMGGAQTAAVPPQPAMNAAPAVTPAAPTGMLSGVPLGAATDDETTKKLAALPSMMAQWQQPAPAPPAPMRLRHPAPPLHIQRLLRRALTPT